MSNDFVNRKMCTGGNAELSKLVQLALFKCGYKWAGYTGTAQSVKYTTSQYLYIDDSGMITHGSDVNMYKHINSKILGLSKARRILNEEI